MPLPAQPLEFKDFSGGITDNYVQGNPTRAQVIDNFFITVDKGLECRRPFVAFSSETPLSTYGQRTNGLYSFLNETVLMAQTARQMFVFENSAWAEITGAGGHNPIEGGDYNSQNSYAEFQRQIYITNDETHPPTKPSKIYKDENGAWTAKTVGLPKANVAGNYTDASLLAKCIRLANAIRTSMISHYNDSIGGQYGSSAATYSTTNIHRYIDKKALSYLSTQTFSASVAIDPTVPSPVPTAAAAATDAATLYTLVYALINSYKAHLEDVLIPTTSKQWLTAGGTPYYHMNIYPGAIGAFYATPHGPHLPLTNNLLPDTVLKAAAQLDDILLKWNLHRKSIWTHSQFNVVADFDKYEPTESAIGEINIGKYVPTVTPDYSDLFRFVNNLKYMYYTHTQNASAGLTQHSVRPNDVYGVGYFCTLPDCTDLPSMYNLIYWLRQLYHLHYLDSTDFSVARPSSAITFTTTAGSANITSVAKTSTAAAVTLTVGSYVFVRDIIATYYFSPPFYGATRILGDTKCYLAKVTASGSGTATLDVAATSSGTYSALSTYSKFHGAVNPAVAAGVTPFIDSTSSTAGDSEALVVVANDRGVEYPIQDGYDVAGWMDLAEELFYALVNHTSNTSTHMVFTGVTTTYSIPSFIYYSSLATGFSNPFFIPEVSQVTYGYHWTDTYTVEPGGIEYETRSNPVYSNPMYVGKTNPVGSVITSADTDIYPNVISVYAASNEVTNIPEIVNNGQSNYDVSNIKMNISRTTAAGTTYYLVDQINNGTSSYSDVTSDIDLVENEPLYTNGGVVGFDEPPYAKFIHNLNGTIYYAGITDNSQYFPQRIVQSVQFAPDAAPATFYLDLDDNITGISSTRSNLLAFCSSAVYRINGGFNNLGQGALTFERLSDTIGAVNQKSIVQTDVGVFFAGGDGFYYTDGYQIIKISLEIDKTYNDLTISDAQKRSIYGTYDRLNRRIWWAVRTTANDSDNSKVFVYYLNFGIKPSGVFTTISSHPHFKPSSVLFHKGDAYYGHELGYVMIMDKGTKADRDVTFFAGALVQTTYAIPYNYTSCAIDAGTIAQRKWWTKLHLLGENIGNAAIQPYVISDLNATGNGIRAMTIMNYTQNITWKDPTITWGDPIIWGPNGKNDMWRRFPSGSLRSDLMQIKFVPADVVVYSSSLINDLPCSTDGGGNAVISQGPYSTTITWPLDADGYYISFETDNYTLKYLITSPLNGDTLSFTDPTFTQPLAVDIGWQISGVKKEQRPSIASFVLHYNLLGDKNEAYPGAKSDSGSGNLGENP